MTAIMKDSLLYLWDQRTLYLGDISGLSEVNQAAPSLMIGLEDDFEIWTPTHPNKIQCRSVLIPAGCYASADNFDKPVAILYLDPCNQDFKALAKSMHNKIDDLYFNCSDLDKKIKTLKLIYNETTPPDSAYFLLQRDILPEASSYPPKPKHYELILRAINIIKANPTENISNKMIADEIGTLTDKQLQRHFKNIVGIPIRRYRLWHRLFVTATLMGFGMSLTEASIDAGFSDLPHFSHTFRSMLGMTPSYVLKRRQHIKIFMGGDNTTTQPFS